MPYWSVTCLYCLGEIIDALLECVPREQQQHPAYLLLVRCQPGAALACPYCNGLLGFDEDGHIQSPDPGWPVFRYGYAELQLKQQADGVPNSTPLTEWALRYRFLHPGAHLPFSSYGYAEHAPPNETVC